MTGLQQIAAHLPAEWGQALQALPPPWPQEAQEVRVRLGQPVSVSAPAGEMPLRAPGGALLRSTRADIERLVARLCDDSVYAHQEELAQGFIGTADGLRVGVAGTAVCRDGRVEALRDVTSLCFRVARPHPDCARPLLPYLLAGGRPCGALICAPPSAGKTTLLRDAARLLARAGYRVSVVDTRGELSAGGGLGGCDVLLRCPPAAGLAQAVRCLAPDFVLLDELGDRAQTAAVLQGMYAGVATVATVHAAGTPQLRARPWLWQAVRAGAFGHLIFLHGRDRPGRIARVAGCEEWSYENGRAAAAVPDGSGGRIAGGGPPARAGAVPAPDAAFVADTGRADRLRGAAAASVAGKPLPV